MVRQPTRPTCCLMQLPPGGSRGPTVAAHRLFGSLPAPLAAPHRCSGWQSALHVARPGPHHHFGGLGLKRFISPARPSFCRALACNGSAVCGNTPLTTSPPPCPCSGAIRAGGAHRPAVCARTRPLQWVLYRPFATSLCPPPCSGPAHGAAHRLCAAC